MPAAGVTLSSFSKGVLRKGPPEAVRMILLISSFRCPASDWKTALCSLSTGRSVTPCSRTSRITISPAITRDSLLARARFFPALTAASVGRSPALPASAETTISAPGWVATAMSPSSPERTRVG